MGFIEVLNPTAEARVQDLPLAKRDSDPKGKVIGLPRAATAVASAIETKAKLSPDSRSANFQPWTHQRYQTKR